MPHIIGATTIGFTATAMLFLAISLVNPLFEKAKKQRTKEFAELDLALADTPSPEISKRHGVIIERH